MKKQHHILFILAVVVSSFLLTACDADPLPYAVCNGYEMPGAPEYTGPTRAHMRIYLNNTPDTPFANDSVIAYNTPIDGINAAPDSIQLVGCVTATPKELLGTCEYSQEDGSEVSVIEIWTADYVAEMRVAQTGEVLDTTEFTLDVPSISECPASALFENGETVKILTPKATDSQIFIDFVTKYFAP